MSRTYKDRPSKWRFPEKEWNYRYYEEHSWGNYSARRGVLTKKRKELDTEYHWMTTPGWWISIFMNRPQRVASKQWEKQIVCYPINNLEDTDPPLIGKKPHIYYW